MKLYITLFVCFVVQVSFGQNLSWIENDNFLLNGSNNEMVNAKPSGISHALSANLLQNTTSTGFVEISDLYIDNEAISEDHPYTGITTLYVSPIDTYNQSSLLNEGYAIRLQKSIGIGLPGSPPSYNSYIRVFGPNNTQLATISDVEPSTSDVLNISKTSNNTLVFKYNGQTLHTATNANAAYYRVAITTSTQDLSFSYNQNGFEITSNSFPEPEVVSSPYNYSFTKTYDSKGMVTGAGVTYFNKWGRAIQSQTKDVLTGRNWATETKYDSQGRAVLNTMSAPINYSANFSYKSSFVRDAGGGTYDLLDLENDPELPESVGSQVGTLGWYYSNNNIDEPYQDITNRPFTRTVFDELNPGSARAVVGGETAQGGEDSDFLINFPQGFSYDVPAAQELYYAFGKDYFPENSEGWFAAHGLAGYADNPATHFISHRAIKSISIDSHGNEVVSFSDLEGKTLAVARSGGDTKYSVVSTIGKQGYVDVHLPKGTSNGDISFLGGSSSGYEIWDLRRGVQVTAGNMTGGNFYRIKHSPLSLYDTVHAINSSGVITTTGNSRGIRYKVNYYDYTLNYFDDAGNLLETVQPLGFDDVNIQNGTPIATPSHSMISNYQYNSFGQLLGAASPDRGTSNFTYREDGQIRFSQNTKQESLGEYSYTNYDDYARPIESGVSQSFYDFSSGSTNASFTITGNPSYISSTSTTISKTGNGWTQGAFNSVESYAGDVELSFTTSKTLVMVGFTSVDPSSNVWQTIEYNMYRQHDGKLLIRQNGAWKKTVYGVNDGDLLSIAREGGTMVFKHNGNIIYESQANNLDPLFIDGNIYYNNTNVEQMVLTNASSTTQNASEADTTVDPDPATCREQIFTLYDIPDQAGLDQALGQSPGSKSYYQQQWLSGNVSKTWTERPETNNTWYSYDVYGRVQWLVQNTVGLGTNRIEYTYDDITSNVTKVIYRDHNNDQFVHRYTYNKVGQLMVVETSSDNLNFEQQARYEYYETGALKRTILADDIQGIDYVYNINGALKSINHPSLESVDDPGQDASDVFGMIIDYHKRDYLRTGTAVTSTTNGTDRYDGNIKSIRWGTAGDPLGTPQHAYQYTYDENKWLQEANYGSATNAGSISLNPNGDYKVGNLSYDPNGNILSLSRKRNTLPSLGNNLDSFNYTYYDGSNQLENVSDAVAYNTTEDAGDLESQSSGNYTYNSIGQLVSNVQDNVTYEYYTTGLVKNVTNGTQQIAFTYNDRGDRVLKETTLPAGITRTHYVRDVGGKPLAIYNTFTPNGGSVTDLGKEHGMYGLSRLGLSKGEIESFEITDHLGNVRAVLQNNGTGSAVYQEDFEDAAHNWVALSNSQTPVVTNGELVGGFDSRSFPETSRIGSPSFGLSQGITYEINLTSTAANVAGVGVELDIVDSTGASILTELLLNNGNAQTHTATFTATSTGAHYIVLSGTGYSGDSRSFYEFIIDNVLIQSLDGANFELIAHKDYYPFGMPMPDRNLEGDYRYAYQGQENDPETGKEAFELRLWDSRIGRWLTTDPYGQYHSPYLGMGNNPMNGIDPDGGFFGRIRALARQLFSGGTVYQNSKGQWAWKKGTLQENGELLIEYKNYGHENFGKVTHFDIDFLDVETKSTFGVVNYSRDIGTVGFKAKLLTVDLASYRAQLNKVDGNFVSSTTNNFIGKNGDFSGTIASGNVETGSIDVKGSYNWKYDSEDGWNTGFKDNFSAGVGAPLLEAKAANISKHGFSFKGGLQEDFGASASITGDPKSPFLAFAVKLVIRTQFEIDFEY